MRTALPRPLAPPPAARRIAVTDAPFFQLPQQENRLALVLDPFSDEVPFTFGIEVFPPGHRTAPHVHPRAHEMFFIMAGTGEAFCNGSRFPIAPGDTVVFPPGCEHGIDVLRGTAGGLSDDQGAGLYCLELMVPNEQFAEFVRQGQRVSGLNGDDMCVLAALGCG